MVLKLYKTDHSSPCRSVFITAEALGLKLDCIEVDLFQNEHYKDEYLKLNPQHTVPTLVDDGKVIWDSHAINIYLVSKYGKDDSLYPNDPYKRAVINQRLHFDSGVLFALFRAIVYPMRLKGVKQIPENLKEEVMQSYEFLNKFLEGQKWVAGDTVTLADICMIPSVMCLDILLPVDPVKYPNVSAWLRKGQELPYFHVNKSGHNDFATFIKKLLSGKL